MSALSHSLHSIGHKHVTEHKNSMNKRFVLSLILVIPSLLFLGYRVYASWDELQSSQWRLIPWYLVSAALALLISFFLNASIWHLVVRSRGARSGFRKNMEIFCMASIARRLPGAIWQIAGRLLLYQQEGIPGQVILQGSVWEIIIQILSALAVFGVFVPWYNVAIPSIANYVWILLLILLPVAIKPSLLDRVFQPLFKRMDSQFAFGGQVESRDVLVWFSVYFVSWISGGLILYFILQTFYAGVNLVLLPALCGFVALSGVVGICVSAIPGGLGLREVSLSVLLAHYLPDPVAVSAAVAFRLWILVGEVAYALLILLMTRSAFPTHTIRPGEHN